MHIYEILRTALARSTQNKSIPAAPTSLPFSFPLYTSLLKQLSQRPETHLLESLMSTVKEEIASNISMRTDSKFRRGLVRAASTHAGS